MQKNAHLRSGAVVLVAFCLLSNLELVHRALGGGEKPQGMELPDFKKRMSQLRGFLPPDATVGYVSDLKLDPTERSLLEYRMTQYALVPVIVEEGSNQQYVIGNFHPPLPIPPELERLTPIKDFGNGVLLFRGTRR